MRTTRSAAARMIPPVLALVGVLGGCTATVPAAGGASTPSIGSAVSAPATTTTGAATPAPTPAATPTTAAGNGPVGFEEEAVAAALRAYHGAVAAGDFPLACTKMTVESATALVGAVQGAGAPAPSCPEALAAVIAQPGAAQAAIEAADSIVVDDVTVEGLSATIRWTSTRQGVPRTDAVSMQSVDGQWRLAGPA